MSNLITPSGIMLAETPDLDARRVIQKARARLVTRSPFFGVIALRMESMETDPGDAAHSTMCTDGKGIYFNAEFVKGRRFEFIVMVLAHECLHIANCHHLRQNGRDSMAWNYAGDFAINSILCEAGMYQPQLDGGLYDARFKGQSAEEIYAYLMKEMQQQPAPSQAGGDGQGQGGQDPSQDGPSMDADAAVQALLNGSGSPSPGQVLPMKNPDGSELSPAQQQKEESKIGTMVRQAQVAEKAMGGGSEATKEALNATEESVQVDWATKLRQFFSEVIQSDYSFMRPSRRFIGRGMIMPGADTDVVGTLAIAVDTSGSIGQTELDVFGAEIEKIAADLEFQRVLVMYVTTEIVHIDEFFEGDEITLEPHGMGGTHFDPPFHHLEAIDFTPSAFIYFTDGHGSVTIAEPEYPCIWVSTGREPGFHGDTFGEVILAKNL